MIRLGSVAFAGIVESGSYTYTKTQQAAGRKFVRAFVIIAAIALLALVIGFFFFGSANLGH
jgi:F0F1-type ATP synthase membrane subunit c/vacuolar-type H+-ATPase subunit K